MNNIKLSPEDYKTVFDECFSLGGFLFSDKPNGFPKIATLFGYPIYSKDGYFIVFVACEYCGQSKGLDTRGNCGKCGAPLSGTRLIMRETSSSVLFEILKIFRDQ